MVRLRKHEMHAIISRNDVHLEVHTLQVQSEVAKTIVDQHQHARQARPEDTMNTRTSMSARSSQTQQQV